MTVLPLVEEYSQLYGQALILMIQEHQKVLKAPAAALKRKLREREIRKIRKRLSVLRDEMDCEELTEANKVVDLLLEEHDEAIKKFKLEGDLSVE